MLVMIYTMKNCQTNAQKTPQNYHTQNICVESEYPAVPFYAPFMVTRLLAKGQGTHCSECHEARKTSAIADLFNICGTGTIYP